VAIAAVEEDAEVVEGATELTPDRFIELQAREQFLLTVSDRGFGKRSSCYDYRLSGRGGKGIAAMVVNDRNGQLVAAFPIDETDQLMLVTDGGQLIRCPVGDVRIASRNTQGVRIFKTGEAEKVVSVERIPDDGTGGNESGGESGGNDAEGDGDTPPDAPAPE
jgi:DNA gyrase subunit A